MEGELFLTSLISVALLLVTAIPGFIIGKLKMIDSEGAVKFLSVMLLYVCQPFVTFNSFLNTPYDSSVLIGLVAVFLFTCVSMSAILFGGYFLVRRFRSIDCDTAGIMAYGGAFGNVGYMCIPFLQLLDPGNHIIILYATCSVVAFNLIAWTLGNYVLTRERRFISLKSAILNPPTLSFIIALPLFMLNINFLGASDLTGAAADAVSGIANICELFSDMVGPLAMTLLGIKLAEMKAKELFNDKRAYIAVAVKLVAAPLIGFALVYLMSTFMDVTPISLNLIALSAMPCANNIMMFATILNRDSTLAAKEVMISTVLSCITIPVILLILTQCAGIYA